MCGPSRQDDGGAPDSDRGEIVASDSHDVGCEAAVGGGDAAFTATPAETDCHDSQGRIPQGVREINLIPADFLTQLSMGRDSLIWYQRHDKDCRSIAHRLRHGKWPRFTPVSLRRERIEEFSLQDGMLMRNRDGTQVIVWPSAKRFEVLYGHHDVSTAAHCGASKMFEVLSRNVWFPGMRRLCDEYVRSCRQCSSKKSTRPQSPPLIPQEADYPNATLVIDILSMPRSAHSSKCQLLTCVDRFSGFVQAYPLESGSADCVADKLAQHFMTFGPPEFAECDSGSNLLKNVRVKELCSFFGIRTRVSVGYCHQAVGKIERRHLDIKRRLRALSSSHGMDWEVLLPGIVFAMNNEPCRTHGFSPYFLYFLRYPHSSLADLAVRPVRKYSDDYVSERLRGLSSVFQRARARQTERMSEYKQQYDRRYRAKYQEYRSGDRVWLKNFGARSKMDDPWLGPYIVSQCVGRRHLDIQDDGGRAYRTHMRNVKCVAARPV